MNESLGSTISIILGPQHIALHYAIDLIGGKHKHARLCHQLSFKFSFMLQQPVDLLKHQRWLEP